MLSRAITTLLIIVVVLATFPALNDTTVMAQGTFNSGSTGADGAFSPTSNINVTVPESGVFNYTTYNVPQGVTVTYLPNSKNTPVIILCTGNVTIGGTVNVDGLAGGGAGVPGRGGPGGFGGGFPAFSFGDFIGISGDGPGGGRGGSSINGSNMGGGGGGGFSAVGNNGGGTNPGTGGPKYGTRLSIPLIGGSGGGSGGASTTARSGAGGGGGAILIASSTSIASTSGNCIITAKGGGGQNAHPVGSGGGGSGGTIRLVANTVTGFMNIFTTGGGGGGGSAPGGNGANGYVRIEGYNLSGYNPSTQNTGVLSMGLPNPAIVSNAPTLRIASVAGINAPTQPAGTINGSPDIVVPSSQSNPVTVAIEATNIPVGTVVQVTLTPTNGTRTIVQSDPLSGTLSSSTSTASITLPAGHSVLMLSVIVDLLAADLPPAIFNGERANRMEVVAIWGGPPRLTYFLPSGRHVTLD